MPEKVEYVIKVRLSNVQIALYKHYLADCAKVRLEKGVEKGTFAFSDYQNLMRVWNHPYALLIPATQQNKNEVLW